MSIGEKVEYRADLLSTNGNVVLDFRMHVASIALWKEIFCHYFEFHICNCYCCCYGFSDICNKIKLLQDLRVQMKLGQRNLKRWLMPPQVRCPFPKNNQELLLHSSHTTLHKICVQMHMSLLHTHSSPKQNIIGWVVQS